MKRMIPLAAIGFSIVITVTGCMSESVPTKTSTPATSDPVNKSTDASNADTKSNGMTMIVSKLQQADQLDGKEDHVIGKCYVCALGMDGKPDYAVQFQGYTAHLCSEGCRKHFQDHAEEVINETPIKSSSPK